LKSEISEHGFSWQLSNDYLGGHREISISLQAKIERYKDISRETGVVALEIVKFRSSGRATEFQVPSDNWGADDFAGITIFLASGASDFVTGTAIP
jgi:hypothetical protein